MSTGHIGWSPDYKTTEQPYPKECGLGNPVPVCVPDPAMELIRELRDWIMDWHAGDGGESDKRCPCSQCEQARKLVARATAHLREGNAEGPAVQAGGGAEVKNWFAYDPDDGVSFWETEGAARASAEKSIQLYRDDAAQGWADEVEGVVYGEIYGRAVMDSTCDYAIEDRRREAGGGGEINGYAHGGNLSEPGERRERPAREGCPGEGNQYPAHSGHKTDATEAPQDAAETVGERAS